MKIRTGGTWIKVFEDPDHGGMACFQFITRSKTMRKRRWMQEVVDWLNELQKLVMPHIPDPFLTIKTKHERGENIFHGHPNFRSMGPWRDWVIIDWGVGHGVLPSHIWCYVVLQNMPIGKRKLHYGGIMSADGDCAVVEVADSALKPHPLIYLPPCSLMWRNSMMMVRLRVGHFT